MVLKTADSSGVLQDRVMIDRDGNLLVLGGLPIHANNDAAVAAGLTAGALYRSNGDPDVVRIVH